MGRNFGRGRLSGLVLTLAGRGATAGCTITITGQVHDPEGWRTESTVPLAQTHYDGGDPGHAVTLGQVIAVSVQTPWGAHPPGLGVQRRRVAGGVQPRHRGAHHHLGVLPGGGRERRRLPP